MGNKIYILSLLLFFFTSKDFAQNLVMNPSFEIYTNCPAGPGSFATDVTSWSQPDTATTDYYNVCYTPLFGGAPSMDVPGNIQGYQQARTGVGYPGIICRENSMGMDDNWREYIQGQLTSPLVAGQTYCVKYYWSLADLSNYSINEMGVYLSNTQINLQQKENLPFTPQLETSGIPLNDTSNWVSFQQNYIATGGEQYIIIGNFRAPVNTTSSSTGLSCSGIPINGGCFAYYYIEDVSVTLGSCCLADITPVGALCINDPSIQLVAASTGGTWSGDGVNPTTGIFNPATAGAGLHTILYTLPCGADSVSINVNACATLVACQETNGNITVSGGTAPYTWARDSTFTDCSGCFGGQCMPPVCNGVPGTISTIFATGTTITPSGTYPFHVNDVNLNSLVIASLTSLPACSNTCPPLTVTASNLVHNSCFGESVGSFDAATSGGASPWDYTLINGGGTTVATFSNIAGTQSFTGLPAGTYTLNVMDNNNCPGTTSVIITEPSGAGTTAIAGPDQSMCSNTATLAGNTPAVGTGLWTLVSGTATITTPSSETSGITGLGAGATVFEWTISNPPCPSSSDQVTITNTGGGLPAAAGPDQSICSSSAILAGNIPDFGTGEWTLISGTGTITNPSSATSVITGLGIGTTVFEWTISNPPCPSTADQITITNTGGGPAVTITAQANVSCYGGNNGSITASASGGAGNLTYAWAPAGGAAATANNLMAGSYTISVTDDNGCVGIETAAITQPDSLTLVISATPTACGSNTGSATATANGGTSPYTYLWSNGSTLSQILNLSSQTYSLTLTDSLGCTQTGSGAVVNTNGPTANAGTDVTIISGSSTLLSASGGVTYSWAPPTGLNCDTCRTPTASPIETSTYCVTVFDNGGCSDTACITVTVTDSLPIVLCGTVFVPNAFTPGNNDLVNDTFKPVASCIHDYRFLIFNRWGEKLFETTNPLEGWDGRFKGKISKQEIYVYQILFFDDINNEFHQYIGKFILLR